MRTFILSVNIHLLNHANYYDTFFIIHSCVTILCYSYYKCSPAGCNSDHIPRYFGKGVPLSFDESPPGWKSEFGFKTFPTVLKLTVWRGNRTTHSSHPLIEVYSMLPCNESQREDSQHHWFCVLILWYRHGTNSSAVFPEMTFQIAERNEGS